MYDKSIADFLDLPKNTTLYHANGFGYLNDGSHFLLTDYDAQHYPCRLLGSTFDISYTNYRNHASINCFKNKGKENRSERRLGVSSDEQINTYSEVVIGSNFNDKIGYYPTGRIDYSKDIHIGKQTIEKSITTPESMMSIRSSFDGKSFSHTKLIEDKKLKKSLEEQDGQVTSVSVTILPNHSIEYAFIDEQWNRVLPNKPSQEGSRIDELSYYAITDEKELNGINKIIDDIQSAQVSSFMKNPNLNDFEKYYEKFNHAKQILFKEIPINFQKIPEELYEQCLKLDKDKDKIQFILSEYQNTLSSQDNSER